MHRKCRLFCIERGRFFWMEKTAHEEAIAGYHNAYINWSKFSSGTFHIWVLDSATLTGVIDAMSLGRYWTVPVGWLAVKEIAVPGSASAVLALGTGGLCTIWLLLPSASPWCMEWPNTWCWLCCSGWIT